MRRSLLTFFLSLVWLIASPSLQLSRHGYLEVGVPQAAAEPAQVEPRQVDNKKPVKKTAKKRVGSSGIVTSNQPGLHPMRTITAPSAPVTTGTVTLPQRHPEYPNVPTVPAVVPESSQDRVARCTHQGALGGLSPGEQGTYIHKCAF